MANKRRFPHVRTCPSPAFVFDPANPRTDESKPRGLDNWGPYTSKTFTPSNPNVCVICQAHIKGKVEQFLHKFLNGISPGTGKFPPFKKGFVSGYHLEGVSLEFFQVHGTTAAAYQRAVQTALEAQGELGRWDLAFVQTEESSHQLRGSDNPYLVTKASFLAQQIPVQEFEEETIEYPTKQLEYTLSNIALATYAKLGGIPWLLKADPTIAHEMVVGLGSCYVGETRFSERERVVGIVSMFSGEGKYFLSSVSKAVPIGEYRQTMLDALRKGIEQARNSLNWQEREHVRLIFHAFKPMKDDEAEAVKALAAELEDFDVEFAFLHLAQDHPFLIFDTEEKEGVFDFETRSTKGEYAPTRGQYIQISKRELLLVLTGPKEVKRPTDGMPFPLLLKLHPASTFTDMSYLAKQVFNFSSHSWRSFLPSSMAVTVSYSQLIARLLGNLALLPKWNSDAMLGRMDRSRWFL